MAITHTKRTIIASVVGLFVFATLVVALRVRTGEQILGRVLEGDELVRIQAESDFDSDGDIDFQDFTVFAAFYEEE